MRALTPVARSSSYDRPPTHDRTHRSGDTWWSAWTAALELLAREVDPLEHAYPRVWVKRAVFAGQPLSGLLRAGDGASLLVLGAHASGAARRMLLGSTSLAAVSRATSPVAILPSPAVAANHPIKEVDGVAA
jgi:nucleotide-binding universal stress UspA family protein